MKDSGIEWIGDIPANWMFCRLKKYFSFEKGKNAALYTQEYIGEHQGTFPVYSGQTESNGVMGLINSYDYDIPKCLFTTTVGAKVMTPKILEGKFSLSQNCLIMKSIQDCCIEFFYYALLPLFDYEKSLIPSYMQPSLRIEDLKKYGFYIPAIIEQKKIADYLDEKCAEIDAVISKTKATIEEYKKLKQSIITEAVTKGVRGNRPMKDSGIEWIGKIPTEWNIAKTSYFFDIQLGKMLQPNQTHPNDTLEKYLCAANLGGNKIKITSLKEMWFSSDEKKSLDIRKGDLLVVEGGDVASCDIITFDLDNVYFQNSIHRARTKSSQDDIRILKYWLWINKNIGYIDLICNKATIAHFSKDKFLSMPFLKIASLEEQNEIADFLDSKCAEIDKLIADKTHLLEEMETYKKSLIYEYVTGKKEVQ